MFTKFKPDGDTVFTRIYHDTGSVASCDIVKYYNGNFLVLAAYAKNYNNVEYSKTNLMVLDTLGNILKSTYTPLSLYEPNLLLHDSMSNKAYVLGIYKSQPGDSAYIYSYLRCLNDTNLQTEVIKNNITGKAWDYIQSAIMQNGSIYATYFSYIPLATTPNDGEIVLLSKMKLVNHNLTMQIAEIGDIDPYVESMYCGNMIMDKDNIIFPVYHGLYGQTIYFCDTLLNLRCFSKSYHPDFPMDSYVANITLTHSDKIVGAGVIYPVSNVDIMDHWIYMSENYNKYLAEGCGNMVGIAEKDLGKNKFNLFPNPADKIVTVTNDGFSGIKVRFVVVNVLNGIQLERSEVFGFRNELDISSLNSGVFFLEIYTGYRKIETIKFIKR